MHDGVDATGHPDVVAHVVLDEREPWASEQVGDVRLTTRDEIVEHDDLVTSVEQRLAEVRAEEAGTARDHDPGHQIRPIP
jgi:hypothetical protein